MNKLLGGILAVVFSVAIFFVLLFSSMEIIIYNMDYYENHYIERDIMSTTKMNLDDLMVVTEKMMDYLNDSRDTLDMKAEIDGELQEVFGEREKLHMIDVKDLFVGARDIRNYAAVFVLVVLVITIWKSKRMLKKILSYIKYVFLGAIGLLLILGGLFYSDFTKYFTIFHEIFFDNDLWLLDPRTDILINMVPEVFFYTTAMIIIVVFAATIFITILSAEVISKKVLKNYR